MWEDDVNKDGGRWLINLEKNKRSTDLDNFWLETLLCLIGEAFEDFSEDVNGAVINIRNKGDKLSLWTRDSRRQDATMKIGRKLKERLRIPNKLVIGFQCNCLNPYSLKKFYGTFKMSTITKQPTLLQ
ncbi:Hypothetical predicted protein [Mytilus galloprovincialis]|uniref:Uncharacterized protein n=1 Tax=Mytilus galloprovincialis TaxID=29158 RepID=A0A8B6DT41_MYTGA|nr:Hypothetical predicted protein [Mytilus galloprovincialis]